MSGEPDFGEIRKVASKALEEYDYLLERYNALVEEHNITKAKLSADVDSLKTVLEPMFDEYGELKAKYQSEKTLRLTAETYAAKVVDNNKQIKRQSAMIMKQLNTSTVSIGDIDINGFGDSTNEDKMQEERINQLNSTISDLQAQNGKLRSENKSHKTEITELRDELGAVISKCTRLETDNLKNNKELKSIKRMSSLAVNNYQQLQENYDRERQLRITAESYAAKLQRTRNSQLEVQRRTLMVDPSKVDLSLESITKKENEELGDEVKVLIEKEKEYLHKIAELEDELKASSTYEKENLNEKLSVLGDELDQIRTDYYDGQSKIKQLEQQVSKLEKERSQGDSANMLPIPPPPPPPPPPTKTLMQSLSDIVKSSKKKKEDRLDRIVGAGKKEGDGMQKALDEMMKRIQGGGGLGLNRVDIGERDPNDESQPGDMKRSDEPEAMITGQAILNNLKKTQRRANIPQQQNESEDELMKHLSRRKKVLDSSIDKAEPSTTA